MQIPFVVMAAVGAFLLALMAVTQGRGESSAPPAAAARTAPVAEVARRVEAIRGLEFESVPRPVEVSPEQARREGLEDLDRSYPERRRRADEEILKLLGVVEPDLDLREMSASVFSEGVAGYYDPRTKRMRTVRGAQTATRVLAEMTLAHELTHALEDQRFGLGLEDAGGTDDAALARLALVEGTATALMTRYADRHFTAEESLGGVLGSAFADTGSLPAFLQAQLTFPYLGGQTFVEALLDRAGGRWTLVDLAERVRPPVSTEQVMHPEKYFGFEAPRRVRIGPVGGGFRRVAAGTLGELQTRELLAEAGGGGSAAAAEGWGGDRYELWQRPPEGSCPAPCRVRDVLATRWVWDTPADEREFARKLTQWVADGLGAEPQGSGAFGLDAGQVAVRRRGGAVTLVMAPSAALARRVADIR